MRNLREFGELNEAAGRKIWIGVMPGAFGYGICVAEESKEACRKALKTAYDGWMKQSKRNVPEDMSTFEKAMEYFGGRVQEITLGKGYHDNFGD